MKKVKAAENTIEEQARAPRRGNFSKAPYRLKNSPIKLNVIGVPLLPRHNKKKNNSENKGIIWANPL
jgi:hypothetical protein